MRFPLRFALLVLLAVQLPAAAQTAAQESIAGSASTSSDDQTGFSFALVGSGSEDAEPADLANVLRLIEPSSARFVLYFDGFSGAAASCTDAALDRRSAALGVSAKPLVPVIGAREWSACAASRGEPVERLNRLRELYFGSDESLGQTRLR